MGVRVEAASLMHEVTGVLVMAGDDRPMLSNHAERRESSSTRTGCVDVSGRSWGVGVGGVYVNVRQSPPTQSIPF